MNFYDDLQSDLIELENAGQLRELRSIRCRGVEAELNGRTLLNFSGNDYLGVAGDAGLRREFYAALSDAADPKWALSAASSRLLTGNAPEYDELETELAAIYGHGKTALCFNSGYHANIGILPALAGKNDLILSDKLNHASIIDALRLSEAEFKRYRHLDCDQLETMLKSSGHKRKFIVSESIFSMDGDAADLKTLVELKERYGAILLVDEAHAVGVRGDRGGGMAVEQGLAGRIDVLIGTFGKAFGSTGAYAIVDPVLRQYLINFMRPLIFSTGLPPVAVAWTTFVLRKMPEFGPRREHLKKISALLRKIIRAADYATGGDTQIVPLMVGDNRAAVELAARLRDRGILVFPIRPPTVPPGTARLRFSLNAGLTAEHIRQAGDAL